MFRLRILARIIIMAALFYFLYPEPAYAYLDPGTGSYMLQLLMAGLFGALFIIKQSWAKIKLFFGNLSLSGKNRKDEQENAKP